MDRRRFLGCAGALGALAGCSTPSPPVLQLAPPGTGYRYLSDKKARTPGIVEDLARRTFRYFWETTDAGTGLAPDRYPTSSPCSIAAVGFALTAYCDRRRARLRHARRGAPAHRRHAALPARSAAGAAGQRHGRLQGLLLSLHRDVRRPARRQVRAVDRRHRAAAVRCAARARVLRQRTTPLEVRDPRDRRRADHARGLALGADAAAVDLARLVARGTASCRTTGAATTRRRSCTCWRSGTPRAPVDPSAWSAWSRCVPARNWSTFHGQQGLQLPAAVRPPVFERVGRLPRTCATRSCASATSTTSRTRAARPMRSAPTRSSTRRGWRGYDADVWGLTACDGPADMLARYRGRAAALSQLRGARRRRRRQQAFVRRRHDRAHRGRLVDRLRARDRGACDRGDGRALRRAHLRRRTVSSMHSTRASASRVDAQRTARSSPASAGSTPTTSASTRARSWR